MIRRVPVSDFPVTITIVERGITKKRTIEENRLVRCRFDNFGFLINQDTAYRLEGHIDSDTVYIRCPKCNRRIPAVYYVENDYNMTENNSRPKRKQKVLSFLEWNGEGDG